MTYFPMTSFSLTYYNISTFYSNYLKYGLLIRIFAHNHVSNVYVNILNTQMSCDNHRSVCKHECEETSNSKLKNKPRQFSEK